MANKLITLENLATFKGKCDDLYPQLVGDIFADGPGYNRIECSTVTLSAGETYTLFMEEDVGIAMCWFYPADQSDGELRLQDWNDTTYRLGGNLNLGMITVVKDNINDIFCYYSVQAEDGMVINTFFPSTIEPYAELVLTCYSLNQSAKYAVKVLRIGSNI